MSMWDPKMLGIITHVTAFYCYLSAHMHSHTHIHLNTLSWLQYLLGGLAEIDVNLVTGRETQTTQATNQLIRSSYGTGKPWRTMTMNESQVASVCDWDIQSANEWICWATGKPRTEEVLCKEIRRTKLTTKSTRLVAAKLNSMSFGG